MLDILLKQMELQEIDKHTGLSSSLCKNVCSLLKSMITAAWISSHSCSSRTECTYCECSIMWHQLAYELVIYLSPVTLAHPPDVRLWHFYLCTLMYFPLCYPKCQLKIFLFMVLMNILASMRNWIRWHSQQEKSSRKWQERKIQWNGAKHADTRSAFGWRCISSYAARVFSTSIRA